MELIWTEEDLKQRFITESNALAEASEDAQKSYYAAFIDSYKKGKAQTPLTLDMIALWQDSILQKKVVPEHAEEIQALLDELTDHLYAQGPGANDAVLVEIIADFYLKFLKFSDANGRLSRLISNYICVWFRRPILIFYAEEADSLKQAQENVFLMRLFIAKKIRDRVFNHLHELMNRVNDNLANSEYLSQSGKMLVIQWRDLALQEQKWKELAH